jgi:hypothetical protein
MDMIAIEVKVDSRILVESNFLMLEPHAPSTSRKFIFKDFRGAESVADILYQGKLTVAVYYLNRDCNWNYYTEFQIRVISHEDSGSDLSIFGNIYQDEQDKPYRQGMTDMFKLWEENREIDWFSLPLNDPLKDDYISACLFYSGISEKLIERDIYEIDMSLVQEEKDFLYLASLAFTGNRGYIGYDLYTFDDCLLTIFRSRGDNFKSVKVMLSNVDLVSESIHSLCQTVTKILLKYKFEIAI